MTRDQVDEYYLTVAEVAEVLRLNQQTVRNWIDQGSLPALRVGRRVRIKRSDLDRLLSEGYSARPDAVPPEAGPSAEDFWGGEPVGVAEPAVGVPSAVGDAAAPATDDSGANGMDSAPNGMDSAANRADSEANGEDRGAGGTESRADRAEPAAHAASVDGAP